MATSSSRRVALTEAMVRDAVEADNLKYERPPYGRLITKELARLTAAVGEDGWCRGIVVPARTETRWFHTYCVPWEVRFLRGRIRFDGEKSGAPFPSAVIVVGRKTAGAILWWDVQAGTLLRSGVV